MKLKLSITLLSAFLVAFVTQNLHASANPWGAPLGEDSSHAAKWMARAKELVRQRALEEQATASSSAESYASGVGPFKNQEILSAAGIEVLIPGEIYYRPTTTLTGKEIFYVCEKVTDENRLEKWHLFRSATARLTDSNTANYPYNILRYLKNPNLPWDADIEFHMGLNESDYEEFMGALAVRVETRPTIRKDLSKIGIGLAGFMLKNDGSYYVQYISLARPTGFVDLPDSLQATCAAYKESYRDILACVTSTAPDGMSLYRNRGIFTNPLAMIKGGYGPLSKIHSWSAQLFERRFMAVAPPEEEKMHEILLATYGGKEGAYLEGQIPLDLLSPEEEALFRSDRGVLDVPCLIATDLLLENAS